MIIRTKKSPRTAGAGRADPAREPQGPGHAPRLHRAGHAHRSRDHRRARRARDAHRQRQRARHVARSRSAAREHAERACNIQAGAGKMPFIAFDLAGGANLTGSEMLIGQSGNPLNFLSTQGYATLGLPGNMTPGSANAAQPALTTSSTPSSVPPGTPTARSCAACRRPRRWRTRANVNGFPIAARSENDTGNNPHNPMYGINRVGADGQLLTLIGSQNTDSGGNSMAPDGDDESGRAAHQSGSRERRHGPRRHGRARHVVHATRTTRSRCSNR